MLTSSTEARKDDPVGEELRSGTRPLLPILQSMIERSFGMSRVVQSASRFLIGDSGLRRFYGLHGVEEDRAREGSGLGARILVRLASEPVRVSLYYPDRLVQHLERHDPREGL